MNKLIKQLIQEATTTHINEDGAGFHQFSKEKFANLIVKECLECAQPDDSYRDSWFEAKDDVCKRIKERFSLE